MNKIMYNKSNIKVILFRITTLIILLIFSFPQFSSADETYPSRIDFEGTPGFALNFKDILNNIIKTKELKIDQKKVIIGDKGFIVDGMQGSLKDRNDIFVKEFFNLARKANSMVDNNEAITMLLLKPSWNIYDRTLWEAAVSEIVINAMNESVVFRISNYKEETNSVRSLNKINSKDGYDCEHIALIKGIITQNIEAKKLYNFRGNVGYKKEFPYYYFANYLFERDKLKSGHAAIYSVATNNVSDFENYTLNMSSTYNFQAFTKGEAIHSYSYYTTKAVNFGKTLITYILDLGDLKFLTGQNIVLGAEQQKYLDEITQYAKEANKLLKLANESRKIFKQEVQLRLNDDNLLSDAEIEEIRIKLQQFATVNKLTDREKLISGLGEMMMVNGTPKTIAYAGLVAGIPGYKDDFKFKRLAIN